MGLAKNRARNVKATKVKLSRVNALKFKKASTKAPNVDVEMVQEHLQDMEVDNNVEVSKLAKKKLTKKQNVRFQRKAELRKCYAAKRLKELVNSTDAMEGAPLDEQLIEQSKAVTQKVNDDRLKKESLPIMLPSKPSQLKVCEKELKVSNIISGRRMSKKKARKVLNQIKRNEREKERKAASMDTA